MCRWSTSPLFFQISDCRFLFLLSDKRFTIERCENARPLSLRWARWSWWKTWKRRNSPKIGARDQGNHPSITVDIIDVSDCFFPFWVFSEVLVLSREPIPEKKVTANLTWKIMFCAWRFATTSSPVGSNPSYMYAYSDMGKTFIHPWCSR